MRPHLYLVLGMHRGGTSATAGLLHHAGARAGKDLLGPGRSNTAGYFEARPVLNAMESLLRASGSFWYDWRPLDLSAADPRSVDRARDALRIYLSEEIAAGGDFTIKDPRNSRAVGFWRDLLGEFDLDVTAVHPVRRPQAVWRSLETRNQTDAGAAALLWLRHMLDAERGSRGMRRVFLHYDDLVAEPGAVLGRVLEMSGRSLAPEAILRAQAHLDAGLRHHAGDETAWPAGAAGRLCEAAHGVLARWGRNGPDADGVVALDDISATFEGLIAPFSEGFGRAEIERQHLATRVRKLEVRVSERTPVMWTGAGVQPNPVAMAELAEMLDRVGEAGPAGALLERAANLAPEDPAVQYRRAQIARRAGRLDEARAAIAISLAQAPSQSEYLELSAALDASRESDTE